MGTRTWAIFLLLITSVVGVRAAEPKPLRQLGEPRLRHGYPISSVAFSPDGSRLATAGGPIVRLFKPMSGEAVEQIAVNKAGQHAVSFSPDGHDKIRLTQEAKLALERRAVSARK